MVTIPGAYLGQGRHGFRRWLLFLGHTLDRVDMDLGDGYYCVIPGAYLGINVLTRLPILLIYHE